VTTPGIHGCANLPDDDWSELMGGPVPYLPGKNGCPIAFSPKQAERTCKRYSNSDLCARHSTELT
jgi:hypothetical protein